MEGLWITKVGFLDIQNLQVYYYPAYILLIGWQQHMAKKFETDHILCS